MAGARAAGVTANAVHTPSVYAREVTQPKASVAVTVKAKLPVCPGTPERTPAGERVRPGGSPGVTEKVY